MSEDARILSDDIQITHHSFCNELQSNLIFQSIYFSFCQACHTHLKSQYIRVFTFLFVCAHQIDIQTQPALSIAIPGQVLPGISSKRLGHLKVQDEEEQSCPVEFSVMMGISVFLLSNMVASNHRQILNPWNVAHEMLQLKHLKCGTDLKFYLKTFNPFWYVFTEPQVARDCCVEQCKELPVWDDTALLAPSRQKSATLSACQWHTLNHYFQNVSSAEVSFKRNIKFLDLSAVSEFDMPFVLVLHDGSILLPLFHY